MASICRLQLVWASAAVIAGLATAAACAHAQGQPWRHGVIEPKSDAGFQVMAIRGGFAAKQGLKLELPYFHNADVKIIGCHWQTVVHSVFARAEFKGPQDLKGATMAISAPNATPDMIGKAYLAQNDVPASEVKFASLGNDPERYKALLGGIALATVISIEFLPIGKTDGIKLVARGSEVMPKYLRLCAVTTGKLLDARREDAVRFLAAQMQGYNYALANRDEELRITREIAGIKAGDPRPEFRFAEAARADTGIDPRMPIPMDKLEWLQQQLVKAGNLSQPFDVKRVVNGDIRAQALARAGLPH
jgi:NitT/TauT family transport system substrate-binding protein